MTIRVFEPSIQVRLIKAGQRSDLATGLTVQATRYGRLTGIDLTPYLSDAGGVQLGKSIRSPMGGFSLSLVDRMHPLGESLSALIEPMDLVEIRLAHSPSDYVAVTDDARSSAGPTGGMPIVMRGFVSSVQRSEAMYGGSPQRSVLVMGHDFGKILQILRIYYLYNTVVGDNVLSALKFFQKYAQAGADKIMPAATFVQLVLDQIINPYLGAITQLADGRVVGAQVINKITAEVSIPGVVSPLSVSNFNEGSMHSFLTEFLDVGSFNELYLDERETGIVLVVRPNPFRNANDQPVNAGTVAATVTIDATDIEGMDLGRSDDGVANYYWVTNAGWQINENMSQQEMSQRGLDKSSPDFYAPFTYVNCAVLHYGFRKMQVASSLGPPLLSNVDAQGVGTVGLDTTNLLGWLENRRTTLAAQNKDNVVFESGTLQLRGNERIKAGMELLVQRGTTSTRYYVTGVTHSFMPFQHFKTSVTVERGTGFIQRAQLATAPYLAESTPQGAV